ncbi:MULTISPECIES: hypothetical protein [Shewanella]|uniref:hypothetical protein n=1 Tax=Shewanella TaxID=22 RepID=UPI001C65C735|nr:MULTISPECIES: hypothetical protein [Shewanella]QYJ76087.1 hypothetical protein K0H79_03620 [Shewanella sp. FJAT-52076]QYK06005.1 hypothetical protein K0H63_03955 [Shewanella zhangzhouensis]
MKTKTTLVLTLITALASSAAVAQDAEFPVLRENCKKAVDIVTNKDLALMKELFLPLDMPDSMYMAHIEKIHHWAFVKPYTGINNFSIDGVRWFENAQQSENETVQGEAVDRGLEEVVWVTYSFDSTDSRSGKSTVRTSHCQFGLKEGKWYMYNLLK